MNQTVNPEVFSLARIDWHIFGTLTFKGVVVSSAIQRKMFWQLIMTLANSLGVHFRSVLWVLRHETGEKLGREHLHFLIAFPENRFGNKSTCFFLKNTWENIGGGIARVHVFSDHLNGLAYVAKNLTAGHIYESTKFSKDCDLTLSKSVVQRLLRNLAKDKQAFNTEKNGESNIAQRAG